jgi:hypothetical protein
MHTEKYNHQRAALNPCCGAASFLAFPGENFMRLKLRLLSYYKARQKLSKVNMKIEALLPLISYDLYGIVEL